MKKSWFSIENKASDTATIRIYDEISAYGIKASEFVSELAAVTAKTINLHINSPGGNVFDGVTIYNALRDHKATVNVKIDGLAASIASVIAMAGDTVDIAKNAMMMIHRAWTYAAGNANDMRATADVLDKIDGGVIASTYLDKTGMSRSDLFVMLNAETWLTAQEAKELGFVDTIGGESDTKACFDLTRYNNVPQAALDRWSAKHEKHQSTERELEHLLRDAGVSKTAALAAVAAIKGESLRDSANDDDVQKLREYRQYQEMKAVLTK